MKLRCIKCRKEQPPEMFYFCPFCGGILDVVNDRLPDLSPDRRMPGVWRYRGALPEVDAENIVSLGEGNTPLIRSRVHGPALFYKLDHLNPSGSFKDRGVSVSVSRAKQMGSRGIVVSSSGNASSSTAAYAARAGLPCIVCVPAHTAPSKIAQARAHGAEVLLIEGSFSNSYDEALRIASQKDYVNTTSTFVNPYNLEGNKTVAYELLEQLGRAPDAILIPTGAGPLVVGAMKGFEELLQQGAVDRLPKMAAVQAAGCAPIAEAFEQGLAEVSEWRKEIRTAAQGISDPLIGYAADGAYTLDIVLRSGGWVTALDEEEIENSVRELAEGEGFYIEPTGAVGLGAYLKLIADGRLAKDALVVCMLTGHGLKQIKKL